jgi:ligand-binding SRPBCC domain-containing protein
VEDRLIAMESVRGVHLRSWFGFAEDGELTRITAEVSYDLPRGAASRMVNRAVGPFVTRAVDHANHALVAGIERQATRA